jgi:hypothetical protein
MRDLLAGGEPLPCAIAGEIRRGVGPAPAQPGLVIQPGPVDE